MDNEERTAVYLDYNATSPIKKAVLDEMVNIYAMHPGNADSRTHEYGNDTKTIVSNARTTISDILGVTSSEVIFTSGSTESNSMAVLGLLKYARKTGRNHFITTTMEHKSVLESMKRLQENGCEVDFVAPDESGRISAAAILSKVKENTLLVSVMHVNSETGIIQPVDEIGAALKESNTYFHIDATQSFGKLNEQIRHLNYDMLSFTAHKFGGPQGIGTLVLKRKKYQLPPIESLFCGGQQERGLRPGTTPVALVVGIAKAAEISNANCEEYLRKCSLIKAQFMDAINGCKFAVNGDPQYCIPNTINISFDGVDAEGVFVAMKENYAFSNGSACNSGSYKPSYVLTSMGLDEKRISEALRISWSDETEADFTQLVAYIKDIQKE